jgi:hypothetical protein
VVDRRVRLTNGVPSWYLSHQVALEEVGDQLRAGLGDNTNESRGSRM